MLPSVLESPSLGFALELGVGASDGTIGETVAEVRTTEPHMGQVEGFWLVGFTRHVWSEAAKAATVVGTYGMNGTSSQSIWFGSQ